jgi:hypothetical protein
MVTIYRSNPPERGKPRTLHPEVPAERASKDEAPRAKARAPRCSNVDRLYDFLAAIAGNGAPCPSATNIAEAMGFNNNADGGKLLAKLIKAGRIRVERPAPCARIIEIVATGDRTAPTAARTYSRRIGTRKTS